MSSFLNGLGKQVRNVRFDKRGKPLALFKQAF
jgi:hypothetical protein